jgi:hypothetical protein
MARNRGAAIRRIGLAVITAASLSLALMPSGVAASELITFGVQLGSGTLTGYASAGAALQVSWKDAAGRLKAQGSVSVPEDGYWGLHAPSGVIAQAGDRFIASDGAGTRTFVVPQLTAVASRVTNVFKGTAPVGSHVIAECIVPGYPVIDVACAEERLAVDNNGHWLYSPRWWNVQGGDRIEMTWNSPHGDWVYFGAEAPYVVVTLGTPQVSGEARQNSTATVHVRDATSNDELGSSSSAVGLDQQFAGTLRNSAGAPVVVAAGQYVTSNVAADAAFVIPDIDVAADVSTETVSGRCGDTGRSVHLVWIRVYRAGAQLPRGFATTTRTDEDGYFSEDMTAIEFPNPSVIKHGDKVLVSCVQRNRDFVQKWFTVP